MSRGRMAAKLLGLTAKQFKQLKGMDKKKILDLLTPAKEAAKRTGPTVGGIIGKGALGLTAAGGLTALAGGIYSAPGMIERNIVSQGLDDSDKPATGVFSSLLSMLPGNAERFSEEGLKDTILDTQLTKVKRSPTALRASQFEGIREPQEGETVEDYAASVGPALRRAEEDANFGSKEGQYQRGAFEAIMQQNLLQAQRESDNRFEIRRDTLQEKIDSREGQQGLLELQLLQNKDQFNRELEYKREKDSADRRQDLIQSIQALGMAFAL